jgi:hypothetical protein
MRKLLLIEPECKHNSHINVNCGFIFNFAKLYDIIYIIGYNTHLDNIKNNLSSEIIDKTNFIYYKQEVYSYIINRDWLFNTIDKFPSDFEIIFLSSHPYIFIPYYFFKKKYIPKTTFIFHGILEAFDISWVKLIKLSFKKQSYFFTTRLFNEVIGLSKFKIIVLSEHILDSIKNNKSFSINNLKFIPHPGLNPIRFIKKYDSSKQKKTTLAITGFRLNRNILNLILNNFKFNNITIDILTQVSEIPNDISKSNQINIHNIKNYDDYINQLNKYTFLLLDFDNNFTYTMSGRFLQAIVIGKTFLQSTPDLLSIEL